MRTNLNEIPFDWEFLDFWISFCVLQILVLRFYTIVLKNTPICLKDQLGNGLFILQSSSFLKFYTDLIENNMIDYKICNMFGNKIISSRVNQTNGDVIIPIEGNYPPGVYLVYFEKYQKSFKFIIQ